MKYPNTKAGHCASASMKVARTNHYLVIIDTRQLDVETIREAKQILINLENQGRLSINPTTRDLAFDVLRYAAEQKD